MPDALRLMAVHAHPDDESSKGAAAMARYVEEGVQVLVVTCTGGERGSVLNPRLQHDQSVLDHLSEIRRQEMNSARQILGVQQAWLGFIDSGLHEGATQGYLPAACFGRADPQQAAKPLVRLIRQFRPHVLTTYPPGGDYPHPDHAMTHEVSMAAVHAAANPIRWPREGRPWQVSKVYYHQQYSQQRLLALDAAMKQAGLGHGFDDWFIPLSAVPAGNLTTRVPCADYFQVRDRALMAHATQIDPDGPFFACPLEIQHQVWPTEDYELAFATIAVHLPEDDLFAGLREPIHLS